MPIAKPSSAPRTVPPTPRARPRPGRDPLQLSQQLLRHLPSGIVVFDAAGRVEQANPAAHAALGFARIQGLSLDDLFRQAELREADGTVLGPAASLMADCYASGRILQRKTLHYTAPEGQCRRLGVTLFPLRGPEQQAPGLICLLTDLTAIHALEEELQRRKRLSDLGEMAAGIAHEFKNGLAIVSGYAQMLASKLRGAPRAQASRILQQAAALNDIATEFLVFARPLTVQPETVELDKLLRQCAAAIRVQDFPQVDIALEGAFLPVAGDAVLLSAAVMNLLRNACEAIVQSRRGGRVAVRFAGCERHMVRILFVDDGPGVPPEVAEKIFIPFFTTKPSGIGLGLAMVHKIVTAHQGSVLLTETAPGRTVFTVLLPATRSAENDL